MNFAEFLREHFLQNNSGRLVLQKVFWYFIGMWKVWKMSLLVTVHPFLHKLFSIDLLIFFSMFLTMREIIFCLMIFNTLSYLSSWLLHFQLIKLFLTIYLYWKLRLAVCLLCFFVFDVSLLHPDFNLENKAQLLFFHS